MFVVAFQCVSCKDSFRRRLVVCGEPRSGLWMDAEACTKIQYASAKYGIQNTETRRLGVRHSVSPYVNFKSIPIPTYCRPCAQ
jgi:hypothetical protein